MPVIPLQLPLPLQLFMSSESAIAVPHAPRPLQSFLALQDSLSPGLQLVLLPLVFAELPAVSVDPIEEAMLMPTKAIVHNFFAFISTPN